jgi:threonine dehydrogenase-like Zn-dependent dehydrogenase
MTTKSLDKVTILGAGVLGGQIAWQSAYSGKTVVVYDLHQAALDQCKTAQQTYAHIYKQDLNATEQMLPDTRRRTPCWPPILPRCCPDSLPSSPGGRRSIVRYILPI